MTEKKINSKRVVATSMLVSVSDVVLNLVVALFTGSTVLLAQSLQGLSDFITGIILFWGVRRSEKIADDNYQFGYGRLVFFWVLIAGVIMFAGTGTLSVYFGYQQLIDPHPIESVYLAIIMLIIGLVSNSYALSLSVRRLHQSDNGANWVRKVRASSLVETKATLIVDFMGTTGAIIGLVSLTVYIFTQNAQFDGIGSMLIGASMMIVSVMLIKDVGSFMVGKSVDKVVHEQIITASKAVEGVIDVLDLRTMYIGPGKLLTLIEVHLNKDLETVRIEKIIDKIKNKVLMDVPMVGHVQVEVETPDKKQRKKPKKTTKLT